MKLFVMCCVVLSLAVCGVEQAEGYDVGRARCVMRCDARYDHCSSAVVHVSKPCDDDYFDCMGDC